MRLTSRRLASSAVPATERSLSHRSITASSNLTKRGPSLTQGISPRLTFDCSVERFTPSLTDNQW